MKLLPLLGLVLLLSGCIMKTGVMTESASPEKIIIANAALSPEEACIKACKEATIPLDNGPCLLNPIENTDWVCDVAHQPRTEIDNQVENQCSAFREGKARHFVEVDANCELIKKV